MPSQHADPCWLQGRRKLARAQQRGSEQRKPVAVGAIVSNHISYADVLVSTTMPGCSLPLACCRGGMADDSGGTVQCDLHSPGTDASHCVVPSAGTHIPASASAKAAALVRGAPPLAQVHMSKWLPSFVARDATTSLPFIGICRRAFRP